MSVDYEDAPSVPLPETTPKMTLRDWFAGQALAGSNWAAWEERCGLNDEIAERCYGKAEAMMKARRRGRAR